MKIKIIIPYYGRLPYNFPFWLKSCEYNKNIDFMLVTDIEITQKMPKNIQVIRITFDNLKLLIEQKLNRKVILTKPYKLCDYKPLYGFIFEDYLKNCDYWGYCDMDMIFGDLECFFEKYCLSNYDKFLKYGHLSLYKNIDKINKLFYKSENFNKIFESESTYGFDEENGINDVFYKEKLSFFDKTIFADITSRVNRFCLSFREKNYKYQLFYKENNKIFEIFYDKGILKKKEYIYIHYQKRLVKNIDVDLDNDKKYSISCKGFSRIEGEINLKVIKKLNPYKGFIFEFFERYVSRFKQYVNRKRRTYEKN